MTNPAPRKSSTVTDTVLVFGKPMRKDDIVRFAGLVAFFLLLVIIVILLWPHMHKLFEPGGVDEMISTVRGAGPGGVFILLGIQILQVIVAFIPGEVVQLAAGALYGPFWGMVIVLLGCLISSYIIYQLVHRLGQPFVEGMVPTKYLEKFRAFEAKGKLEPLVFLLFLIPGLPKDTFTYLVPLTNMDVRKYLTITTVARIPGVFMSTFAAAGLMDGNIKQTVIVLVVLVILVVLGYIFKDKLIAMLGRESR